MDAWSQRGRAPAQKQLLSTRVNSKKSDQRTQRQEAVLLRILLEGVPKSRRNGSHLEKKQLIAVAFRKQL